MARIYDSYYTFKSPVLFHAGARVRIFQRTDGRGVVLVSELSDSAKGGGDLPSYDVVLREMHDLTAGEFLIRDYTFIDHHAVGVLEQDAQGRVVRVKFSERFREINFKFADDGSVEIVREHGLHRYRVRELCEDSLVD